MKFRKLRIAWSVVWGLAAVLLIAVWLRSTHHLDVLFGPVYGSRNATISSGDGRLTIVAFWSDPRGSMSQWTHQIYLVQNLPADRESRPSLGFKKRGPLLGFSSLQPAKGNGYTNDDGIGVIVPYWFVFLIFGMLATLSWTTLRFTLRTLLIATTLVAVGLGLVAWPVK
jgi:hypothetical protein